MKKILPLLFISLLIPSVCFAMLSPTTVWEVRTTGASDNGGGFDSALGGTDYSQQDVAQESQADLSCVGSTYQVISALATFTPAMVGNIIYISNTGTLGNFVVGYYEIVSWTDANTIDLDRDPTNGTGDTLASFKVGGAVDHPYRVGADFITDPTAKIWVKKGTYTYIGGSAVLDATYIPVVDGYDTTRGDNPTVEADMPKFNGDNTAEIGIYCNNTIISCVGYNTTDTGIDATYIAVNCIGYNNPGGGVIAENAINCVGYNNGIGIAAGYIAENCIAYNNTSIGFLTRSAINCMGYNNDINFSSNGVSNAILNCISLNGITLGFQNTSGIFYFDYNCYYGNGTDLSGITAGSHDVNADPLFTDPTGTPPDFTLQSTSPCLNAGTPGGMPGLTGSYGYNIGVDQKGAGGGTTSHTFTYGSIL